MPHNYQPVEQKDEARLSDEEFLDTEALLPSTVKKSFVLPKSNIYCLSLHLLLTLGLLIGLRVQSLQRQSTCPKLLPMELRKLAFTQIFLDYMTSD